MNVYDRLLVVFGVAVAAPPVVVLWWFLSRAIEPPIILYLVVPGVVLLGAVVALVVCRRSRMAMILAPCVVVGGCYAVTLMAEKVGRHRVTEFCEDVLRLRQGSNPPADILAQFSDAGGNECVVLDHTWGLWEMRVYADGQYLGDLGIMKVTGGDFNVSYASMAKEP